MRAEPLGEDELRRLLGSTGALRRGHFILSSGLHSPLYVQCAQLLQSPRLAERVGHTLARRLAPLRPASILAPALGGLIIGHEVARGLNVPFRFTEREQGGAMRLRRGFSLAPGERVAIVEDAVTTGRSTLETAALAQAAGAEVVAVGAIIDRTGGKAPFALPFFSLLKLEIPTYDPASGAPMPDWGPPEKPGSRA